MALKRKTNAILVVLVCIGLAAAAAYFYHLKKAEEKTGKPQPVLAGPDMENNPLTSRFVSQVVVHPKNAEVVYATVVAQGVFKSPDRGASWEPINNGIKNLFIFQFVIDPFEPQTLYLGTLGGGVYRSEDEGNTWVEANRGLTNTTIEGLFAHPQRPGVLYAATTGGGMFMSEDRGARWTSISRGLPPWDHNNIQSFPLAAPSDPAA